MITRIELTNFMSHKHTVIEPAPGLTVLVGPNNIGKSAVVAALQILCHNESSTHVIRHGERECLIHVTTDDGHTIEWRRKTSPSYLIDGQQFDRLGKGNVPDELHKALRLSKAEGFDIHFGTQKAPIFLLGDKEREAANFFASSSDAIRLVEIQKRHKDKHDDAKREKKALEAESKQLNAELAELEPVVEVDDRLTALEANYDDLLAVAAWLDLAEKQAVELQAKTDAVAVQSQLAGALVGLTSPPQLVSTELLVSQIGALEAADRKHIVATWRADALHVLPEPPACFDVDRLNAQIESLATLSAIVERGEAEARVLTPLTAPPHLADADALERQIGRLASCEASLVAEQSEQAALAELARPPELTDVSRLLDQLRTHARLMAQLEARQAEAVALSGLSAAPVPEETARLQAHIEQLARVEAEVATLARASADCAAELGELASELRAAAVDARCEVCGAELDPERLLARAAAGLGVHDHE